MITSSNSKTTSETSTHTRNDWDFLPTAFSAVTGVSIGLLIGNYLGWI